MAWLPSSRDDVHRGLWIPDLREGSFSPLSSNCQSSLPGMCLTQRLSTQRLRRCGLSVTSPIQSRPCAGSSSSSLSPTSHAVPAAPRKNKNVHVVICDAVALGPPASQRTLAVPLVVAIGNGAITRCGAVRCRCESVHLNSASSRQWLDVRQGRPVPRAHCDRHLKSTALPDRCCECGAPPTLALCCRLRQVELTLTGPNCALTSAITWRKVALRQPGEALQRT